MLHVIYLIPTPAVIWGWFPRSRSVLLMCAESGHPRLISHKIIFEVFQPLWPRRLNIIDNLPWQCRALLCMAQ